MFNYVSANRSSKMFVLVWKKKPFPESCILRETEDCSPKSRSSMSQACHRCYHLFFHRIFTVSQLLILSKHLSYLMVRILVMYMFQVNEHWTVNIFFHYLPNDVFLIPKKIHDLKYWYSNILSRYQQWIPVEFLTSNQRTTVYSKICLIQPIILYHSPYPRLYRLRVFSPFSYITNTLSALIIVFT